jgi:ABC-type cobalt transport system substrate-binding protein
MKFRVKSLEFCRGVWQYSLTKNYWILVFVFILLLTSHFSLPASAFAADWGGVDESVVEKYAKEHGREAHEPLINTDQGDLLLFVFLLAGTVGGFIGGYYWRTLTENRTEKSGVPGHRAKTE